MNLSDDFKFLLLGLGVGIAALAGVYFVGKKAGDTAKDALNAVNPFNHDNIFATGVNSLGATITGNKDFTLGGAIYDATHPVFDPNAKPVPPEPVPSIDTPILY